MATQDTASTEASATQQAAPGVSITIEKNGPYLVKGGVPLTEDAVVPAETGHHMEYRHVKDFDTGKVYALCRCGASKNKPFCDGSHTQINFDGTETADRAPYLARVEAYYGDELALLDDNRCAYARLCHREHGDVWRLTQIAEDDELKEEAVQASWHCPTGRLEHHDSKTGHIYEQEYDPSIVILEDPGEHCSGPLFVRGGIQLIGADGFEYEVRNRYALCRCGASPEKPFCDAVHDTIHFNDGSEALDGKWGDHDSSFDETAKLDE